MEKRRPGQPKKPDELKAKYERMAVLPDTYKRIKKNAKKKKMKIVNYIEEIVP